MLDFRNICPHCQALSLQNLEAEMTRKWRALDGSFLLWRLTCQLKRRILKRVLSSKKNFRKSPLIENPLYTLKLTKDILSFPMSPHKSRGFTSRVNGKACPRLERGQSRPPPRQLRPLVCLPPRPWPANASP